MAAKGLKLAFNRAVGNLIRCTLNLSEVDLCFANFTMQITSHDMKCTIDLSVETVAVKHLVNRCRLGTYLSS